MLFFNYFKLNMPIIKSAKKALKQSIKKHSRNENFKDLFKEARKAFENAIKSNDLTKAKEIFFNTKKDGKNVKS
jgi:ribosomal protein S20